jgi:uncharacterized protein
MTPTLPAAVQRPFDWRNAVGWLIAAVMAAMLMLSPAYAQTFPQLTGQVVDDANLLSPAQKADLTTKLQALEAQSSHQVVVVTVPDLQGYEIEDYGYKLGRAWGIGRKKVDDGLLLIIAPKERKVRIEVGYGLEPIVTDALSSVIIQTKIVPAFRNGDMAGGIVAGTDALVDLLKLPNDQAEARAKALVGEHRKRQSGGIPASLIFWVFILGFILLSTIRRGLGGGRRYGSSPIMLWGPGLGGGWGGGSGGGSSWGGGGGGFSGGGGSFGGGGSSGSW